MMELMICPVSSSTTNIRFFSASKPSYLPEHQPRTWHKHSTTPLSHVLPGDLICPLVVYLNVRPRPHTTRYILPPVSFLISSPSSIFRCFTSTLVPFSWSTKSIKSSG